MPANESVDIFAAAADILQRIDYTTLSLSLDDYEAARRSYEALCNGAAKPPRKRRQRKPRIDTMIKAAERAGKKVASITTEGVTLTFGEAADKSANEADNELARWRQQKKNAH
jgi:hypothetical protein